MTAAGTYFGFHGAAEPAPPAWRALDAAVARWTRQHGGSPRLAELAGWASHADGEGNSAIALTLPSDALAALQAEPLLGAGTPPFVIDRGHFYLRRNHRHECAVADRLAERRRADAGRADAEHADIDALFSGDDPQATALQRAAVRQVAGRRLFVLTGGPGTGKTTTVLRMLLALHARAPQHGVRVAAPTGKAAQRLTAALRDGAQAQQARQGAVPGLAQVQALEATTLHRLLEWRGDRFRRDATHPLDADVVVVDEASMVDLATFHALLDALPPAALLVLVGDADQLASVATGSVFMDLVAALEADGDGLVRLQHGFRADRALLPLLAAVRAGDASAFAAALAAHPLRIATIDLTGTPVLRQALAHWGEALHAQCEADGVFVALPDADEARTAQVHRALAAVQRRQLLCALRSGPYGAETADAAIARQLQQRLGESGAWFPGRVVMLTGNDHHAGLFNGDLGVCLRDAHGRLGVWFTGTGTAPVCFAPQALPPHQGGFAITIHKSQGSEYDTVAVLLPPDADHRILSRQLLYTAVSRARRALQLWSGGGALQRALATPVTRIGALRQRLSAPEDAARG